VDGEHKKKNVATPKTRVEKLGAFAGFDSAGSALAYTGPGTKTISPKRPQEVWEKKVWKREKKSEGPQGNDQEGGGGRFVRLGKGERGYQTKNDRAKT